MPGHEIGYSIGLLVASSILSVAGTLLALRISASRSAGS